MVRAFRHHLWKSAPLRGALLGLVVAALLGGGALRASSRNAARDGPGRGRDGLSSAAPTEVRIRLAPPRGSARFVVEPAALAAFTLEAQLHDVPGLSARLVDVPPRLALRRTAAPRERWRVELEVHVDHELQLHARVCPTDRARCQSLSARGAAEHPGAPAARLAHTITEILGLSAAEAPFVEPEPPSRDPYAVLLLGRSAASLIGLIPSAEARGDPREDPMNRAVFVDPSMGLGWSLLARRAETPAERVEALARILRPRPGDLADLAAARAEADQPESAWRSWQAYLQKRPGDLRFVTQTAAAAAGVADEAQLQHLLASLPRDLAEDPTVTLPIEVALADRAGTTSDALLRAWQEGVPRDPRPVQRRLQRFIDEAAFDRALELAPELERRGQPDEARRLMVALASNLGDAERALDAARSMDRPELLRRLEIEHSPNGQPLDEATSPELRLRRAERHLRRYAPRLALREVQSILTDRPWWPEAIEVERRAWRALGEPDRAATAKARVIAADPLFYEATP